MQLGTSERIKISQGGPYGRFRGAHRKAITLVLVFVWAVVSAALILGQGPNPAFEAVIDRPGLPRVLLIGDSISIAYTLPVRKLLEGKANLHRIPENGGPTSRGLAEIDRWLGEGSWDVIHFNWGLHDIKVMEAGNNQVPLEDYQKNLRRLVARMQQTGAILIWAATTPVPDTRVNPVRSNHDVLAYNLVARRVMQENDISINDLYSFARPRLSEIQKPANVHFIEAGSEKLARPVVDQILLALQERR